MKQTTLFALTLLLGLALISSIGKSLRAADDAKPKAIELYNGKDLTGWGYKMGDKFEAFDGKTESTDGRYTARADGILCVNPGKPGEKTKQLWTVQKFPGDFELRLEFRAAVNADSGVFVRGPQLQCRDY